MSVCISTITVKDLHIASHLCETFVVCIGELCAAFWAELSIHTTRCNLFQRSLSVGSNQTSFLTQQSQPSAWVENVAQSF